MIKSNLRLFLEQIAAAFKGLSSFGSHTAALVSSNPLLTVKVEEDIDPLESAKMKEEMEVDGKHNEIEFEGERILFFFSLSSHSAELSSSPLRLPRGPQNCFRRVEYGSNREQSRNG